jgi:hypothetical protein
MLGQISTTQLFVATGECLQTLLLIGEQAGLLNLSAIVVIQTFPRWVVFKKSAATTISYLLAFIVGHFQTAPLVAELVAGISPRAIDFNC